MMPFVRDERLDLLKLGKRERRERERRKGGKQNDGQAGREAGPAPWERGSEQ